MRGEIEQRLVNRLKVMRSAIRLKHSIRADNEWNAKADKIRKAFHLKVQQGKLLPVLDVEKTLDA